MTKSHAKITLLGTARREKFPFLQKIDMYGSFFLLWTLWEIPYMIDALLGDHVNAYIPYEMLMHGPITLNPDSNPGDEDRVICNPHFQTFLGSPAYLTDDFMGTVLTKGSSEAFLALPEVQDSIALLQNEDNTTTDHRMYIGIRLTEVCEILPVNMEDGGCISYTDILNECLNRLCVDKLFLCWWNPLAQIRMVIFAHVFTFLPGLFVVCLLLFDPPPAGFQLIAKPWIAAISLCCSSILALVYALLTGSQISKYFDQAVFFETYPVVEDEDGHSAGYVYEYGNGFIFCVIGSCVNFIFACSYAYVTIFTPSYPRHLSRIKQRRGHFNMETKKIRRKAGLEEEDGDDPIPGPELTEV